mmetsp:Transcript_61843/g.135262  ORF Transcript_61843/g.135262 Transcript_61843/m.135262 type:complete len:82 (+) Transcript_61843:462-707(+)
MYDVKAAALHHQGRGTPMVKNGACCEFLVADIPTTNAFSNELASLEGSDQRRDPHTMRAFKSWKLGGNQPARRRAASTPRI